MTDNPCLRVTKFKKSKGRDRIASSDECLALLEECKNSRNEHLLPVMLLAITTGMRRGEILRVTWNCINFDRQEIYLKETKKGRTRSISIVGKACELLRSHYLKRNALFKKKCPHNLAQDKDFIFNPETGLTAYYSNRNTYSRYFHSEASIKDYITLPGSFVKHVRSYQEQFCIDF
ncbi:site-specific integrase [Neochlamydia sp. EPS4]|uniref:site-specific integrase n=1 Tax=Neochlamydia sp. EPS4 TaxID=1478175 RepID=UPI000694CAE1|nr:site-specific integrase [Neochlamydia sp. EPS4]